MEKIVNPIIITIDGPVASGKSSVARGVAQKLKSSYLSSGLLYRALAHILVTTYGYTAQELSSGPDAEHVQHVFQSGVLEYNYSISCGGSVLYNKSDITKHLKSAACDDWSSRVSPHEYVREYLMQFQRSFASKQSCIVEGRDCGSIVFPQANHKFFVTASLAERACRWQNMQKDRGDNFSLEYCQHYVHERDERDSKREVAPLIQPENAVVVDTTDMSLEQVIDYIVSVL